MPTIKRIYSRGNDDPAENVYETARIEVELVVDTSKCKTKVASAVLPEDYDAPEGVPVSDDTFPDSTEDQVTEQQAACEEDEEDPKQERLSPKDEKIADKKLCVGTVMVHLNYKAISSTDEADFANIGRNFELFVPANRGRKQLTFTKKPGAPVGPPISPSGSTLTASLPLGTIPCRGGTLTGKAQIRFAPPPGRVPGIIAESIDYKVTITPCGKVTVQTIVVTERLNRPGGVITPLIDITPGGMGPVPAPYPKKPGRKRP